MSSISRCFLGIIKFTLLALYLFVLYELLITPAILDWSVYGIILSLVIAGLLIRSLPPDSRRTLTVLGLAFLMSVKAMDSLTFLAWYWRAAGTAVIFTVLFIVSRLLGRVSYRRFTTVFLVALVLNLTVNLVEVPLWTEFSLKWRSPVLYRQEGMVDYFPLQTADINNDGKAEIITQGNLEAVRKEREGIADEAEKNRFLKREDNNYLVYTWNGQTFSQLTRHDYNSVQLIEALQPDYVNFPYYGTDWRLTSTGLAQKLTPLLTREDLVERTMRFGDAPLVALALDLQSIEQRLKDENRLLPVVMPEVRHKLKPGPGPASTLRMDKPFNLLALIRNSGAEGSAYELAGSFNGRTFSAPIEATAILGAGRLVRGAAAQVVVLGEKLQVYDISPEGKTRLLNEITTEQINDIPTAEALLADINADGEDELLLNTERAKILKLDKNGQWQVLWASRDESFRFEGVAPLGKNDKAHIIALARSNVRNNRTRYMTGYAYSPAGLEQKWRVFTGPMINLRAADVDGDKENELAGYIYKKHLVLVMEKHRLPVAPALYVLTAALILCGFARQMRQGRNAKGGEGHA